MLPFAAIFRVVLYLGIQAGLVPREVDRFQRM